MNAGKCFLNNCCSNNSLREVIQLFFNVLRLKWNQQVVSIHNSYHPLTVQKPEARDNSVLKHHAS